MSFVFKEASMNDQDMQLFVGLPTPDELAAANNVTPRTIRRWIASGLLPHVRINGKVRIPLTKAKEKLQGLSEPSTRRGRPRKRVAANKPVGAA